MTSSQQYTGCMQTNTKDTTSCHFHLEKWQENGFHCHKIDQLSGVYKTPANNHQFALLSIRTVWSIPQRHNTTPCKRSQLWEAGKLQQCCTVATHRSFVPSHKRGCWVPNWCNCVRRPKFTILWWHVGEVSVFNKFFFLIVDTCLNCKDTAQQSCAMVPKWRFLHPVFSASRMQHISDMHSKFALRPHHVWNSGSMVDIQSPTAEIRRGRKRKKKDTTGQKYNGLPYYIERP